MNGSTASMKQILIVDDSETSILFLKMSLEGYDAVAVTSGREMWTQLSRSIPSLILMDVVMPEEDGYQLAEKLALNEVYKDIPIIFQTTKDSSEDLEKAFESGAVDYIRKPVDAKELRARIKSVLKIKELEKELNSALDLIRKDLGLARKIQNKIIPDDTRIRNGLQFYAKYLPMVEVGGDFYFITEMSPQITRIFIADATGHGIQSALITMLIKSEYENLADKIADPSDLLFNLNNIFVQKYYSLDTLFSAFLIDIDLNENKIVYSSAGHPEQVLISKASVQFMHKTGRLIGVVTDTKYEQVEMKFEKGDRIFLFTDGIYEEFNEANEIYGEEELHDMLKNNNRNPIKENIDFLISDVKEFMGTRAQDDDITIIGIEISP